MKRGIILLLVLALLLSLCACGNTAQEAKTEPVETEPTPTEPISINGGEIQSKIEVEHVTASNGTEEKKADDTKELAEPIVIVDDDYCVITLVSMYVTDLQVGYNALVENKTDYTISIDFDDVSVDGFMNIVSVYNATITAGNKGYIKFAVVRADREDVSARSPNVTSMDDMKDVKGTIKVYSKDGSKLTKLDVLEVAF